MRLWRRRRVGSDGAPTTRPVARALREDAEARFAESFGVPLPASDPEGVRAAIETVTTALRDDRFGGDFHAALSLASALDRMATRYLPPAGFRCAGGCGKVAYHTIGKDYVVVFVWCEECYVRVFGVPAPGFVGFDADGFYWEMGLRDDPPESTRFDSDTTGRSG